MSNLDLVGGGGGGGGYGIGGGESSAALAAGGGAPSSTAPSSDNKPNERISKDLERARQELNDVKMEMREMVTGFNPLKFNQDAGQQPHYAKKYDDAKNRLESFEQTNKLISDINTAIRMYQRNPNTENAIKLNELYNILEGPHRTEKYNNARFGAPEYIVHLIRLKQAIRKVLHKEKVNVDDVEAALQKQEFNYQEQKLILDAFEYMTSSGTFLVELGTDGIGALWRTALNGMGFVGKLILKFYNSSAKTISPASMSLLRAIGNLRNNFSDMFLFNKTQLIQKLESNEMTTPVGSVGSSVSSSVRSVLSRIPENEILNERQLGNLLEIEDAEHEDANRQGDVMSQLSVGSDEAEQVAPQSEEEKAQVAALNSTQLPSNLRAAIAGFLGGKKSKKQRKSKKQAKQIKSQKKSKKQRKHSRKH